MSETVNQSCANATNDSTHAILILSCDIFEDTWSPFFKLFHRHFVECNIPLYLGTNTKGYKDKKAITILSGVDQDWSSSLNNILTQIHEDYILVLLDDFFITSKVDEDRLQKCFEFMASSNVKHIHLKTSIKPKNVISNHYGQYGLYEKAMPYAVNVIGFWDKKYLQNLLIAGENPWNFEIMGSYRASYDSGFYCLIEPLFDDLHGIEKGMWFDSALKYLGDQGLIDDRQLARPVLKNRFKIKSVIQSIYFDIVKCIPWRMRVKLMYLLRKLVISY